MRDKCKLCVNYEEHICLIHKRARSAGKKRLCVYFDAKPTKQKMYAPHLRYRSKAEIKRIKLQEQINNEKMKEMQSILDQEKLKSVSFNPTAVAVESEKKIKIKQNAFKGVIKNMFRRKVI